MPKISVIVPNYNHARFLCRRIDTILGQTFRDFELILLDDCSTDESAAILREYTSDPRVRLEFNDHNSGSTFKQWNKGVRLARGKYVWIAESDDYADAHLLERLVGLLDANPEVTFGYCRSRCVSEDGRLGRFADYNPRDPDSTRWTADFCMDGHELCRQHFAWFTAVQNASAVVFRRGIYEQVGGPDEALRLCGDWKLWAGMALEGKVAYVCEPMNYFRFHDKSVRSEAAKASTSAIEYLHVSRWILDRVKVSNAELQRICEARAEEWVPALLSLRTSPALKLAIARSATALDPHPIHRFFRPALLAVRLKIRRHWRDMLHPPGKNVGEESTIE
jgi:glycosyltransferase involved in cell wall biosynthesis